MRIWRLVAFSFVLPVCVAGIVARGQESRPSEAAVRGTISQVHPLGVVTLQLPDPGTGEAAPLKDFLVTAGTTLTLDGKPCELSQLARGLAVVVAPSTEEAPPTRIDAYTHVTDGAEHKLQGAVEKVSSGSVEVLLDNRDRRTAAVNVTRDTKVTIDGQAGGIGEVKRRMYAVVTYVGDEAKEVAVRTWIDDNKAHNVAGMVQRFGDGRIVIHYGPANDEGFDISLPIGGNLEVLRGGAKAEAAAIQPGLVVRMRYRGGAVESVSLGGP